MKYLSFSRDETIIKQIPLPYNLGDNVIDIDTFLRECGLLKENEEIFISEDIE